MRLIQSTKPIYQLNQPIDLYICQRRHHLTSRLRDLFHQPNQPTNPSNQLTFTSARAVVASPTNDTIDEFFFESDDEKQQK